VNVEVRPLRDAAELEAARQLCWDYRDVLFDSNEEGRAIAERFYGRAHYADLMARLDALHAPPDGLLLGAFVDGVQVGTGAYYRFDADRAEVKRVYVSDAARGSGAGAALVRGLIAGARAAGYRSLVLDTHMEFTAARRLYQREGFVERDAYYDPPDIAAAVLRYYECQLVA
jgi:GNAT superfamily N-acetyltransferase